MLPAARSPFRVPTPPPLPRGAPINLPLQMVTDDVRRLAADLDAVLSPRPGGGSRRVLPHWGHALSRPVRDDTEEENGFDWLAEADRHRVSPRAPGSQEAAGWVRKARRQRVADRMRNAVSWAIALALGGLIVGLCTYVLLGRLPGADELVALAQKLWL